MKDGVLCVQFLCDSSSPRLCFLVRPNYDRFLRVKILNSILSQQRHRREIVRWNVEDLGDIFQTMQMSVDGHEGCHAHSFKELGYSETAHCFARLEPSVLSSI